MTGFPAEVNMTLTIGLFSRQSASLPISTTGHAVMSKDQKPTKPAPQPQQPVSQPKTPSSPRPQDYSIKIETRPLIRKT